jgi:hypothetical protein
MLDIIKDVSAVLGCISIALGLFFKLNKSARDWISKVISRKKCEAKQEETLRGLCNKLDAYIESNEEFKKTILEDMEVQKDFSRDQCRNIIKDIFYRYCETKKIPLYELKVATDAFNTYSQKLHANHYTALLYNEIEKWEVDYTHSFEEDE